MVSFLFVLLLFFSYRTQFIESKSFYRTRQKKIVNAVLIKTVSTSSSEDCLRECFITEDCNTFNTIEETTGRYICQLYKNHRTCNPNLQSDNKASVYFSSKVCIFKLKVNNGKYLAEGEDTFLEMVDDGTLFTLENGHVLLMETTGCIGKDETRRFLTAEPQSLTDKCVQFAITGDKLVFENYCPRPDNINVILETTTMNYTCLGVSVEYQSA